MITEFTGSLLSSAGVLTSAALLVSAALVGGSVFRYQKKQNARDAMGGRISPAKSYWLGLAIFAWFFLPLCLTLPTRS